MHWRFGFPLLVLARSSQPSLVSLGALAQAQDNHFAPWMRCLDVSPSAICEGVNERPIAVTFSSSATNNDDEVTTTAKDDVTITMLYFVSR